MTNGLFMNLNKKYRRNTTKIDISARTHTQIHTYLHNYTRIYTLYKYSLPLSTYKHFFKFMLDSYVDEEIGAV